MDCGARKEGKTTMNHVILIGRLTRDPELRYTPKGTAVTTFTLAVGRQFTNQDGEKEADFIPVVTWGKVAKNCADYIGKGRLVAVEGRIQVRWYEKDKQKRKVTEVVAKKVQFLDYKKNEKPSVEASDEDLPDFGEINLDDLTF